MEPNAQQQGPLQSEPRNSLHQVTPLSKYLAMVLFIILPFLGGYIGYVYAPEKVVEVEKIVQVPVPSVEEKTDTQKEMIQDANRIIFPRSQELALELPQEWNVQKDKDVGGSISSNYYVLDEEGRMVFKLGFPLREVGYEPLRGEDRRTFLTEAGFELDVVDRIMRDDPTTGFAHYMQGIQRDWGGDFLQDSFEIFVPFREELYARTAEEHQSGDGFETRYKNYSEYLDEKDSIEDIIKSISKRQAGKQSKIGNIDLYSSQIGYTISLPVGVSAQEEPAQFSNSALTRYEGNFGSLCISASYGCGGVGLQGWMQSADTIFSADGTEMKLTMWTRGEEVYITLDSLEPVPAGFSSDAQIQLLTSTAQLETAKSILSSITFTE